MDENEGDGLSFSPLLTNGVLWFEMFYTKAEEMASYVDNINALGYTRLFWNVTKKRGGRKGPDLTFNSIAY